MNYTLRFPELTPSFLVLALPVYAAVVLARIVFFPEILYDASLVMVALSLMVGAALIVVPAINPVLATVLLFLAGRSAFGPIWVGVADVFFLIIMGFVIVALRNLVFPQNSFQRVVVNVHPILLGMISFSVLYGVRFGFSQATPYAIEKVVRVSLFSLALMLITAHVMIREEARKNFVTIYLVAVGLMSSLALAIAVAKYGLLGIQRIVPIGGGPITLGRFTGFAALICLALYLRNGGKISLLGFIWFTAVTLLNGSRGPLLALILTVPLCILPSLLVPSVQKRAMRLLAFFTVSVFGLVGVFFMAVASGAPFAWRYVILFTSDGGGSSVAQRLKWVSQTGEYFSLAPLWGNGVASWGILTGSSKKEGYPHNIFTELLVENGILTSAVFVSCIVAAALLGLWLLLSAHNPSQFFDGMIGAGLLVFSLLGAQVSGDLFDNRYIWVAIGWLAAVYFCYQSEHLRFSPGMFGVPSSGSRTGSTASPESIPR